MSGQPLWGPVLPVVYNTIPMSSDFPPAIVGYGGSFYCFWVQKDSNMLAYCVLDRQESDVWEVTSCLVSIQVLGDVVPAGEPETAYESPSLVVYGGKIHMVFPDKEGQLVHIQLDPTNGMWDSRYLVGGRSITSARLALFQGQIFCAYTTNASGKIEIRRWDRRGWFNTFSADGLLFSASSLALFELHGMLNLYLVPITGGAAVRHYIYNNRAMFSWTLQNAPVDGALMAGSGITGAGVTNTGFLAYLAGGQTITDGRATITTKQLNPTLPDQQFSARLKTQSTAADLAPEAPELGIVGNTLMAIWNDGAAFWYTTRRVWKSIPPLSRWMSSLGSQTPISHLTIPGTHDSAAVSFLPIVSTQYMSIGAQLRAGIRYIDLRAGFSNAINNTSFTGLSDDLIAYHGPYPIRHSVNLFSPNYVTIKEIFEQCYSFLNHPDSSRECILMQIKQEYPLKPNDAQKALFADSMMALINKHETENPNRRIWRLEPTLPTLAEVRGRIQLLRRFEGVTRGRFPAGTGINVSIGWPENGSGEIFPLGTLPQDHDFQINLQDRYDWVYDFMAHVNKFQLVKEGLELAKGDNDPRRWHINFASAIAKYAFLDGTKIALGNEVQQPEDGKSPWPRHFYGVNKRLADFFSKSGKGHYGTILMDYPEIPGGLILSMIKTNDFPG